MLALGLMFSFMAIVTDSCYALPAGTGGSSLRKNPG
jgi:hypothetical protein